MKNIIPCIFFIDEMYDHKRVFLTPKNYTRSLAPFITAMRLFYLAACCCPGTRCVVGRRKRERERDVVEFIAESVDDAWDQVAIGSKL